MKSARMQKKAGNNVMGMIRAAGLGYEYLRYEEEGQEPEVTKAIEDVSLEIQKGQFIAVLGHNGSGKSTLAKHINALLVPTEGTMWVDDMKTTDEEDVWKIRQKAGMVFQNPDNQIIGNVVEEDVGFGPENLGVPTDEIWKRVEESLAATGMISYRAHSPNKLSGGSCRRRRFISPTRRMTDSSSAMVSSAVASAVASGIFVTGMPQAVAAATSTRS